jgi:hypothetical protein
MDSSECSKERRSGLPAIPEDVESRLTELQRHTLASLGGFGWSIKFVRRPLFQDQVIVLVDPSGKLHAVLRDDGSIDQDLDFEIR